MTAILIDIEGTVGSIAFVQQVLFPYARQRLPDFLREHATEPDVAEQISATAAEIGCADDDLDAVIAALIGWIDADHKATPLKALQGMIWEAGYADGDYRAHLYADAADALRRWHQAGVPLYVYSSGSAHAQRLFFGHSEAGDLTPLMSGYFDTTYGGKRDAASYQRIVDAVGMPAHNIVFLSDVPEELDAARTTGLRTVWVIRAVEGRYRLQDGADSPHVVVAELTDPVLQTLLD